MAYSVSKGADRPSEVLGIKGMNNLQLFAYIVAGAVMTTYMSIIVSPVTPMIAIGIGSAGIIAGFYWVVDRSRKYGENGVGKDEAGKDAPTTITVRSARCFNVQK